jgi:chaperonin GroEL
LLRGAARLSRLAAMTYGPLPRTVAVERLVGSGPPEVLDSGATVARRMIELPDPFENAGAMLVRDTLLRVHERVGDGSALTAVLLHSLLRESARPLESEMDPLLLRADLETGVARAQCALRAQARPVDSAEALIATHAFDPQLTALLAEVVESVGADGMVLVESGQATETTREYQDGVRWDEGYLSPYFVTDGSGCARIIQPRVLVTDLPIERTDQLVPLLELCVANGDRRVLIVTPELRDAAAGLLLLNRDRGVLEGVLAVKAPTGDGVLEDLAILTGSRCLRAAAGDRLENVRDGDLGRARQAWARHDGYTILGAGGDRAAIRARTITARAELATVRDNPAARRSCERRIANLCGVAAVVRVGGASETGRESLRLRVEAATRSAQLALLEGVVTGGGAALLHCACDGSPGERILGHALGSPLRLIARLAGYDAGSIVSEARRRPAMAFDVVRGVWTDALVDPYPVVAAALEATASAAVTAITAEAVIRRGR